MAINPLPLAGVGLAAVAVAGGLYASGTGTAPEQAKPLVSLKGEDGYKDSSSDSTKFGYKFSSYFLSTKSPNNNEVWGKRVAALNKSDLSLAENSYFTSLKGQAQVDSLKTTCKQQYDSTSITSSDKAKWKEVWVYCSLGGTAPVTLESSEVQEEKTNLASSGIWNGKVGEGKKAELLSIDSKDNEWIWDIKEKERKIDTTDTFFNGKDTKKLKEICKESYQENKNGTGNQTETQAVKYCSKPRVTEN